MTIRKYTPTDKASVIDLFRLNTPAYFSIDEEKELIYYLENFAQNYYVIDIDNQIMGCGGFNTTDEPGIARISWDIIHPDSHGKGLGSALVRYRIEEIRKLKDIDTLCVRTSQVAYRFYARFGFEITAIEKDYWAPGFDLYRMERDIKDG